MRSIASSLVCRQFRLSLSRSVHPNPALQTTVNQTASRPSPCLYRLCRHSASTETMSSPGDIHEDDRGLKRVLETEEHEGGARSRRRKKNPPLFDACRSVYQAAKQNDCNRAMECFRTARDEGLRLPQSVVNTLLYLLVGGDKWLETARALCKPNAEKPSSMSELEKSRDEILLYMEQQQLVGDEMVSVAQARLAACLGDPDGAFKFAQKLLMDGSPARLRYFTPALVGFAERGELEKAKEIQDLLDANNVDMSELELRLLLRACTRTAVAYTDAESILRRIGKELTVLERETIEEARVYFTSENARAAFTEGRLANKQMWLVEDVKVNSQGFSLTAGDHLEPVDLSDSDWDDFLKAFKDLASKQERSKNGFQTFVEWIDEHGPFSLVVDAANIGFHKQNYGAGGFSFLQINKVINFLQEKFPERRLLIVLHESRTKGNTARQPLAHELLRRLQERNQLYKTPFGSNDDWYWLYAALKARGDGLLVSNDECRDHIFQLLTPKYFLKWKERHLVRYELLEGQPVIQLPPMYTSCTQQLSNGTWMLPYENDGEEKWLCAKPL